MPKGARFLRAILLLSALPLFGLEWRIAPGESSLLLPETWTLYDDAEAGRVSFIRPDRSVIFQLSVYPGDRYGDDRQMMEDHLADLDTVESDSSRFLYRGRPVSLADAAFHSGGALVRGWFLFIEREDYDYYLLGITPAELYEETLPWILSCLDSFSPDEDARRLPGPIGTLLAAGASNPGRAVLDFGGTPLALPYNKGREEAAQLLIEREAALLASYSDPEEFAAAWQRYYQMIYRDSYADLSPLAAALEEALTGKSAGEKARAVLSWLQDFEYGSIDRFSDLLAPLSVLLQRKGDCDALGLVYCRLMDELGIPSVLMTSHVYSHAMAALKLDEKGAGVFYKGERYVVAEMTKKVDLGLIGSEMADANNWVVFSPGTPETGIFRIKE